MSDTIDWNDDARLVAYALGELDGSAREEIDRALLSDPTCRAALDEIAEFLPEVERAVRVGGVDNSEGLASEARASISPRTHEQPHPHPKCRSRIRSSWRSKASVGPRRSSRRNRRGMRSSSAKTLQISQIACAAQTTPSSPRAGYSLISNSTASAMRPRASSIFS